MRANDAMESPLPATRRSSLGSLRAYARRLLGVTRVPTYYLPWLTGPALQCALIINNLESRFRPGDNEGPFPVTVTQHDADGRVVRTYEVTLPDSVATCEVQLTPTRAGHGFVVVAAGRIWSEIYVTVPDGRTYTGTHGRHEFIECYPPHTRALMAALGGGLALARRTIPAFVRDQYIYRRPDSRSHLLLLNLSNVTNRLRLVVVRDGAVAGARLLALPPMGARLVDPTAMAPARTGVDRVRIEGNAWFNLYLVGAGTRDLAGPLSLMHVK